MGGGSLSTGGQATAYATATVPAGSSCVSEQRSCAEGVLTGSYVNASCSVVTPRSCDLPWGGTLASGASTTAYATQAAPYGSTCTSEQRTCANGALSGSYSYASCKVADPAPCNLPWGGTLASGASIAAYTMSAALAPDTCAAHAETLSCTNGVLSDASAVQNCTAITGPLTASDSSTVYATLSATSYTLTNTSGATHPNKLSAGAVIGGGLKAAPCTGNFTLTFTADKLIAYSGFLGVTAVDSTNHDMVGAGNQTLVEQAWYSSWGSFLLRKMVHYAYAGNTSTSFNYSVSRSGTSLSGSVTGITTGTGYTDSATVTSGTAMSPFIYFDKDTSSGATTTQTVNITNVSYTCN